ncbi:DNA ligase-1 [Raineyella antarctica]|uniref:DNA ligase n=1 Tax=Raineyella antarctica TaxID=1577474 RepID=A0A1G6HBU4_9ACTN|nr:ATP-dependent DNA ligase [Raineyella antarctica]SDB91767.1 DNA ligase-1 [Raineyella antarctica]
MRLADLVRTSTAVAATRSRLEKRHLLAAALADVDPDEADVVATFLSGQLRQRRTGLGWRSLGSVPEPADEPTLAPLQVDAALEALSQLSGPGSRQSREAAVVELFGRATAPEQDFLRRLVTGELRQGALDALLLEAIAEAADVPITAVRRAAMYSAYTGPVAAAALAGGEAALVDFRLQVLRPVRPMLASPAADVDAALDDLDGAQVAVDAKLDGVRIQVHRAGAEVMVLTRSLEDITERVPEIVELVGTLGVRSVILDGEALVLGADGRPRPFQETGARALSRDAETLRGATPLTSYFFDVLHLDGRDLVDLPARDRFALLDSVLPAAAVVPRRMMADAADVRAFFDEVLARGHEGIVVKDLAAPYAAGRRGAAWRKVKPRHTLDLVVLAVEWGSGRRHGKLSNIHLGARDGDSLVMLGKTFKGMTDEMLAWQTQRFLELETGRHGNVVEVRPEQVVEVAFDGVQRSSRYPGGVALRFARVLRYREDKTAAEADTLDSVRTIGGLGT